MPRPTLRLVLTQKTGILKTKVAVPLAAVVVATIVLVGLGVLVGARLPWGEKSARTIEGTAFLDDAEAGNASFQWDGSSETAGFDASSIWWFDSSSRGTGQVPCLREGRAVPVEAGVMWISHPGGGAHEQVVWIRCL